eukprot:852568-Rhodomonas_salina.2
MESVCFLTSANIVLFETGLERGGGGGFAPAVAAAAVGDVQRLRARPGSALGFRGWGLGVRNKAVRV